MTEPATLQLCMGSACHQHRVYDVLPQLQELLKECDLKNQIVLKGAFCLGPCMQAIVMKIGDQMVADINPRNLETKFYKEILPILNQDGAA